MSGPHVRLLRARPALTSPARARVDPTGRLRRTFVSQSARDSFERLRLSRENTENGATHGRNTQTQSERRRRGGGLKAEQDGLAGSRTGW